MACETFDTVISGAQYVTTQWPATRQVLMKFKLSKVFGESLFEIVSLVSLKSDDKDKQAKQLEAFKKAVHVLLSQNTPEEITFLIKDVLTCGATKREGKRIIGSNFDEIYNDAGMQDMYKAFLFVVKSNYSDFFKGQKGAEALLAAVEARL